MQIRVLCVGDVVGRPGRGALGNALPGLIKERQIDLVGVNGENAAGGTGLPPQMYDKLLHYGADIVTLGDHCYRRRELIEQLEQSDQLIRPANLPREAAGKGWTVFTTNKGVTVGVVVVLGRMYMKPAECPFHAVDRALEQLSGAAQVVLVEIHAEATSEKIAMGWHLDGRVNLVYGTHTHVPTADCCILPKGTAYITDIGMTGPYRSVLGRRVDRVLRSLITGMPCPYDVATQDVRISGVLVEINSITGGAEHIELVTIPVQQNNQFEQVQP